MKNLNLKLLLELIDKVTAPIQRVRQKFVQSMSNMQSSVSALSKKLRFEMHYALLLMQERFSKFGETLKKTGKQMSEMGKFFTTRLTLPIAGFGAFAVRSAGNIEELRDRLAVLLNDAPKAEEMVKRLRGMKSPFEMDDLGNAAAQLLAAGYSAEDAMQRIEFLGQVAAGTKNSVSDLAAMYITLRKNGKASDDDLISMMRQNIPIVKLLAKELGKTEKQIFALAAKGKISFAQVKEALQNATEEGGIFFNQMEKKTNTIFGVFVQLKKTIADAFADVGQALFVDLDIAGKVKTLTQFLRNLAEGFMKLPKPVKDFIFWAALITATIGPVIFVIGQLVHGIGLIAIGIANLMPALIWLGGMLGYVGKFFVALATVARAFLLPMLAAIGEAIMAVGAAILATPVGWILAAIAAIVGGGYLLVKNWDKVSAFFTGMWAGVKNTFSSAADYIMDKLQPLLSALAALRARWQQLKEFASNNPVTLGLQKLMGSDSADAAAAPDAPGETTPASATPADPVGSRNVKVDTGGELRIRIDVDGQATVEKSKPNDAGMGYRVDTGLMNGAY